MRIFHLRLLALLCAFPMCAFGQGEAEGVIKATTKLRPDGSQAITIVDPDQRTAEETLKNAAGKVMKKTVFLLDERNFALGAVHYDAKGGVFYKESFRRDSADHVVESSFTSADGKSLGRRVFNYRGDKVSGVEDYDANGNRIAAASTPSPARPDKHRH